jgi:anti-anti-sigma factor
MQIRIRAQSGYLEVHAQGALTTEAAAELLAEVAKEMAPVPRDIALNLGDIDTISAGALPYVFRIRQQAERAQRQLTITAVSQPVRRLLDQTNVADKLTLTGV